MPAELRPDDEVTDWQYQWQGPDGAESWWPAMPFVHAQIYLVTLFPAFVVGVLLAWGFGGGLVSRVVPVLACVGIGWLVVSEWVKHVDATRPIGWHRAVLRSELRAPRPPLPAQRAVVATSAAALLDVPAPSPAPDADDEGEDDGDADFGELLAPAPALERPGRDPWTGVLA